MHKAIVAVAILGCGWLLPSAVSAEEQAGKTVEFTILHLNDVYEIERSGNQPLGGLSRVARMRKKLVEVNPRTYTVLSGDALSPSPLASAIIEGDELAGRQMVAVLNVMGLDFATFGNHEFDLSKDQLRQRLLESTFTWLSSNITDAVGRVLPGVPSHVILEARDAGELVRVGLIGLTIDSTRPDYVRFLDPIAVAREKVRQMRGSCDVIIAVTHLSIETDRRVAAAVPEIHLILGGHEHESSFECRATAERYSAPIAKADSNAKTVTVHRLAFNTRTRHLTIRSRLVPVSDETDPKTGEERDDVDLRTDRLAKYWKKRGFDALKDTFGRDPSEIVAHSDVVLDGLDSSVRFRPTNLTELIAEAMLASAPGARGAIFNSGSIRIDDVLDPGEISVYDIYRVLPYPGKVIRAALDGALLLDLLNKGATITDEGGFLQTARIDRTADGRWLLGGEPIKSGELYPIAIAEYLLRGRELIYGDVRKPETINARLNLVWDSLSAAKKEPPTRPGTLDRDIRRVVMRYMTTNERGRIKLPPKSSGEKRPIPAHAVDWPVVEVDVDPPAKASSQLCGLPLAALLMTPLAKVDEPARAKALIDRFHQEKSPVWADGDAATFFFRARPTRLSSSRAEKSSRLNGFLRATSGPRPSSRRSSSGPSSRIISRPPSREVQHRHD